MWNGKKKAVTFSFDDGVLQDARLIELLNKYGLKATFNINSGKLGLNEQLSVLGKEVAHCKIPAERLREVYAGHEVAAHTVHHPFLPSLTDEEVIREVADDCTTLQRLVGYPICGMAYPCGGENNNDRVAELIAKNTPVRYARTTVPSHSFALQGNLMRFNPTAHTVDPLLFSLAEEFLSYNGEEPALLYIWGHGYEYDADAPSWESLERLFAMLSGKEDIFYCTNKEAFGIE
ncbi:MAG: polysaccharide deacetylase family protein [Clostridia bacterium]|nr:polysaccharide deacetylase family protein [Clostridia bacterium]